MEKSTTVINGQKLMLIVTRVAAKEVDVQVASEHGAPIVATLRAVGQGCWGVLRINLREAEHIAPDSESFRILQADIYDLAVRAAHSQERKAA
ncbi:MAG: hypothetical protein ACYDD9_02085 [Acidithiobacillus sp.]|uniref:Uncharacterized protein n=1 Tax=Acidithiobacillus thiooxidans TaxID=930 RepID=A0A1C2IU13_ACITH|nr:MULTISPECIES: hypothetical protein [Acidithiobacillus]MBU2772647.1 hypothetical protein [Acidithiobacillus ferrooxidans]OCX68257.1 hypothetical protein A6P07_18720 [Acidithiobacillus thiooxidans]OCX75810.1 hypothetical protein A6O24_09525 [Acidithiobacillus thiooxidans]OCX79551.1 hypothetical protein A6O26_16515 [Acidithiobacillus thiooxidans]OCX86320.1 hypothetical protein A6M27_13125 [Acidithiobacillus thiooxidans]